MNQRLLGVEPNQSVARREPCSSHNPQRKALPMNGFPARMSGILTIFALAMLVATPAFSTEPLPSASLAAEGAVGMIDFPDDGVFAPVPAHRHRNPDGGLGGWVADTAYVGKDARVSGNAMVFGNAWVAGNAQVY